MEREGKEISDFAALFTVGAAAGLYFTDMDIPMGCLYMSASASFTLSVAFAALAALTVLPGGSFRRQVPASCAPYALLAAFFFCGFSSPAIAGICEGFIHPGPGPVRRAADISAENLEEMIRSIPFAHSESNAMVLALITGDKSGLPRSINESFRISGASHLLALSGMHLGLIYVILGKVFSVLGNSPAAVRTRSALVTAVSGFYTLMTGAGASIARAFLFIILNEAARCTGRKRIPTNIFCAALMIQVLWSPEVLKSIGFQLSYLAMAGIYLLYPVMKGWYREHLEDGSEEEYGEKPDRRMKSPMKRLWDTAAMSISCQIFTAPAVWYHFGTFPVYFLITNLIAIPLSSAIIYISILVTGLHALGICPGFLIRADDMMIQAMCSSLEIISGL